MTLADFSEHLDGKGSRGSREGEWKSALGLKVKCRRTNKPSKWWKESPAVAGHLAFRAPLG